MAVRGGSSGFMNSGLIRLMEDFVEVLGESRRDGTRGSQQALFARFLGRLRQSVPNGQD